MFELVTMCVRCKESEATARTFAGRLCDACIARQTSMDMMYDLRMELSNRYDDPMIPFNMSADEVLTFFPLSTRLSYQQLIERSNRK